MESSNGRLRDECVSTSDFAHITEAQAVLKDRRIEYNDYRPHQSLGGLTFAAYWNAHHTNRHTASSTGGCKSAQHRRCGLSPSRGACGAWC